MRSLAGLGHRGSATPNEERAADYLVEQLHAAGIEAHKEHFRSCTSLGGRILVHVLVAALGLALLPWSAALSVLVSVFALASFFIETTTRGIVLTRLLPTSRSSSAVGRIPAISGNARRRVVVCGHIDTQRAGLIWDKLIVKTFSSLLGPVPGPARSPMIVLTLYMFAQIVLGILQLCGVEVSVYVSYALGIYYAGAALVLGQWAIGRFVPGACDNATGAAAALVLATRWREQTPPDAQSDVELIVLLPGSEEVGSIGTAAWLDANKEILAATPTRFLNLDTLGYGAPHCITTDSSLSGPQFHYPKALLQRAAEAGQRVGLPGAVAKSPPTPTDGLSFLSRGVPGLTIMTYQKGYYVPHLHQMGDTADAMDFGITARATEFAWEVLKELARP